LIAAQRAAGEAPFATLKEQLRPSALRPALLAAKAALVALMQNTKSAAAAISMINLIGAFSLEQA
jgi:ABC-type arginine/histidine transport system permease subunit